MFPAREHDTGLTRRETLAARGWGWGCWAWPALSKGRGVAPPAPLPLVPWPRDRRSSRPARHVIHIFANGGPSHVDTFDPKPSLDKYDGKPLPIENLRTERKTGAAFPSPFKFKKYGQSGIEVSELFAQHGRDASTTCA